jgi:hypothetical protein
VPLSQLGVDDVGLTTSRAPRTTRSPRSVRARGPRLPIAAIQARAGRAAKLVDVAWKDSRDFAIQFIHDDFGAAAPGADAIIAICDSIPPSRSSQDKRCASSHDRRWSLPVRLAEHPSVICSCSSPACSSTTRLAT